MVGLVSRFAVQLTRDMLQEEQAQALSLLQVEVQYVYST